MERRRFVRHVVIGASITVLGGTVPVRASACAVTGPAIWQITRRRTDLPLIFFDGFRLTENGSLQVATWSGQRSLLAVAEPVALSQDRADAFRDLVEGKMPGLFGGGQAPTGRGPTIEIGRRGRSGSRSAVMAPEDVELVALLADLTMQVTLQDPEPGHYLWSKPVSAARPVDLDLRDMACEQPIAAAIAESIETGRMIVPVQEGYQDYFTGPFRSRVEFGARLDGGYLGYGVLGTG